jgi:phosphohistidine phosphatase SixA
MSLLALLVAPAQSIMAEGNGILWEALRSGGHVALLRHAVAPGTGDPPEFTLGDCASQRNLSDEGREQAQRIGARFRANGIERAAVFSSQWCRCQETASLLDLGPVTEFPLLNSFFQDYERREPQTQQLRQWIAERDTSEPLVLVTHYVNIAALTRVRPGSGELVVVRLNEAGEISVLGSIRTD